jgi:3-hydroxyisobutyrate dehydrogenase
MKAGVIGLGSIGGGVAQCLARADMLSAVYDVFPDVATKLDIGFSNAASPRAVAERSDVILIAVFDAKQVRDVLEGEDGLLAAGRPDVPIVLLSTVAVDDYHALRLLSAEAGIELLDCGVTGGSSAASGGLVCLIGGSETAVEKVRPALEGFAKGVFRMGEAGAGMAGKIARNVIVYGTWLVEHEAFKLAKAVGVDGPQLISAVLESRFSMSPPCGWARRDPDFGLETVDENFRERLASLLSKDLGAALELADEFDVQLPATRLAKASSKEITGLAREQAI